MAGKRRRIRQNDNRTGKFCISLILIIFMVVMTIQIKNVYQKDQDYTAKQAELELQLKAEQDVSLSTVEHGLTKNRKR